MAASSPGAGARDDMATLGQHSITPIDLVVVNLYPFVKAAATPDIAFGALVEEIDIGGPSMVRSAAKNFQDVLVVVDPADYRARARRARAAGRAVARIPLRSRAKGVCAHRRLRLRDRRNARGIRRRRRTAFTRAARTSVTPAAAVAEPAQDQRAALRRKSSSAGGVVCHRTAASAWGRRRCCRAKSCRSPICSTSIRPRASRSSSPSRRRRSSSTRIRAERRSALSIEEAYVRAREADSLAAFGGIIGLNRPIDAATARALVSTFIEAVIAPAVEDEARPILAAKAEHARGRCRLEDRR